MSTFEQRFAEKLTIYQKSYKLDDLNESNDTALLQIMIKTELMIEDLQSEIQLLIQESSVERASDIKKLADLLRDATGSITTLQKTLAIDRKTRKEEDSGSVADYINSLLKASKEYTNERLSHVYCPTCNILVARYAPAQSHTAFSVSTQCSQCNKTVRISRSEKDTMHDIPKLDRAWRRKYRAEVIQPRRTSRQAEDSAETTAADPFTMNEDVHTDSLIIDSAVTRQNYLDESEKDV